MTRAISVAMLSLVAALSSAPAIAAAETDEDRPLSRAAQEHLPTDWRWLTETAIAGNEVWRILGLFLSILVALVAGRLLRFALNVAAGRFDARHRHLIAATLRALGRASVFLLLVLGLEAGMEFPKLNDTVAGVVATILNVLITIAVGYAIYC